MTSTRVEACSRLGLEAGDPLAGTASTASGYLVLEHGGPWGVKPFRDAVFTDRAGAPTRLGPWLQDQLAPLGVTPLLARRHGARHGLPQPVTVMLVALTADGGRGARTTVPTVTDLFDWDLPDLLTTLREGRLPAGWEELHPQVLVCTHARRDACCGELGRPLVAALRTVTEEGTWEVSHLGGHRLAANTLVLPDGVVYGRVRPELAPALWDAHQQGRVVVEAMRGRAFLDPPVQAAEVAVRQATGTDRADAVHLVQRTTEGTRSTTLWAVAGRTWRAVVDTVPGSGPPRPASCGKEPGPPPPRQVVVEVGDVADPGRPAAAWDSAHALAGGVEDPHPAVVAAIAALPPGSAVDVACGTGRNALWLADRGWRVTGIDFSRVALDRADGEARRRELSVDWVLGDARHWVPPVPVDLVVMSFVHLPGVVQRATRWLRPGGHLVLVGHARRNLTEGVGGPRDPRLLHEPAELRRSLEAAGLHVLRCEEIRRGEAIDVVAVARAPR